MLPAYVYYSNSSDNWYQSPMIAEDEPTIGPLTSAAKWGSQDFVFYGGNPKSEMELTYICMDAIPFAVKTVKVELDF